MIYLTRHLLAVSMSALFLVASPTALAAGTILVFGDSLSAGHGLADMRTGWVRLLEERIAAQGLSYQVANESVSGETTTGGRARFAMAFERHQPDILVLELGGNDALRGFPVDAMRENLLAMTRHAQDGGARVVIAGMKVPPNYGPRYARDFEQVFVDVAEVTASLRVPFLLEGIATDESLMQSDGIHPNEAAQPLIMELVWQVLAPVLRAQSQPR
ncbi:MAG: arylesterase [Gammaproteobacteria bacterium]|nr:arylesterase [Gammaproteobacteria bacterium]MCY4198942.1 arylesterase [Gammaproteobacteria bacterium]